MPPGEPTQNAFIQSFSGLLRHELHETLFMSLARARVILERCRARSTEPPQCVFL
ncbi:integrase core domain-containing protein [Bradyrhizobium sp. CCBAU 21362]|uniref:integrase core domain-containing protein n=1 Tax=Bradyrhizobium sp. CCBAU 21362 TaxID=1325082 RepID=UPI003FA4D0A2